MFWAGSIVIFGRVEVGGWRGTGRGGLIGGRAAAVGDGWYGGRETGDGGRAERVRPRRLNIKWLVEPLSHADPSELRLLYSFGLCRNKIGWAVSKMSTWAGS